MKSFLTIVFLILCCLFSANIMANNKNNVNLDMKLKLTFDDKEVVIKLYNNSAVRQLIKLLPSTFEFSDFANQEKITNFDKKLSLEDAPRGMVAKAGMVFIYAPWGNMGIFYKDVNNKVDRNLIPLGEVESGLEYILSENNNFKAKIEIIN